ncbi:MAG: hypothetical protein AAFZ15_16100 [Bacteroidota bacterium]
MKKFLFITLFFLGSFITAEAQIWVGIENLSSYTWEYRIGTNSPGPIPTGVALTMYLPNGTFPVGWLASYQSGSCAASGTYTGAVGLTTPIMSCAAAGMSYSVAEINPGEYSISITFFDN